MITEIYAETIKMLKFKSRYKILALLTFLPPLLLGTIFIQAFTVSNTDSGYPLAVVNNDSEDVNNWKSKMLEALASHQGTIPYFNIEIVSNQTAEQLFNQRDVYAIVYIPSNFSRSMELNDPISLQAKINSIHEDISKNLRLGLEGRIYEFYKYYLLEEGSRPGIIVEKELYYQQELPRPDYMISGVLVLAIMWFNLFDGGLFGSTENGYHTKEEIDMAVNGKFHSKIGKTLATMISSSFFTIMLLIIFLFLYGEFIPNIGSLFVIVTVFIVLSIIFGTIGVNYGMRVADFRAVPAPSIILAIILWIFSGSINPLEFSAGSEIFRLLPSSASNKIFTATFFGRGIESMFESWIILFIWLIIVLSFFEFKPVINKFRFKPK